MGAPVLPYFSDQFMGIKPPRANQPQITAIPWAIMYAYPFGGYPSMDGTNDYYTIETATYIRKTSANAIRYSISNNTVAAILSGATHVLGLCKASNGNVYVIAYLQSTREMRLGVLTSPLTSSSVAAVGASRVCPLDIAVTSLGNVTLVDIGGGNLRLKTSLSNNFLYTFTLSNQGAFLGEAIVIQKDHQINSTRPCNYETADGTIQCTGIYNGNIITVIRNAIAANINVGFVGVSNNGSARIAKWYDHVRIVGSGNDVYGLTALDPISFDQWLVDVCNAMGI